MNPRASERLRGVQDTIITLADILFTCTIFGAILGATESYNSNYIMSLNIKWDAAALINFWSQSLKGGSIKQFCRIDFSLHNLHVLVYYYIATYLVPL